MRLKLLVLAFAILAVAVAIAAFQEPLQEKAPAPSVSLGCDRVVWKDTELELQASVSNIKTPYFQWKIDSNAAGNVTKLKKKFEPGEHKVVLNVSFGSQMLQANQTITVIDSTEGIGLRDFQASKNQWGFQTTYREKDAGVKGVKISIDSLPYREVNPCGKLSTKGLLAGKHEWKAEYRGKTIASGNFALKEVSEIKIERISINKSYRAGDTVDGKIILKNTGTTVIKGFEIKTVIINRNYEWMGDKAKKESSSQYNSEIKPGEAYEIPIRVTIPEKVGGIRPSGIYTITVSLALDGKTVDTKVANTKVD